MFQTIKVDDRITLEQIAEHHAQPLLDLLNNNRSFLRQWLPWVDYMNSLDDFKTYIDRCSQQHAQGTDYGYVIYYDKKMAGRIGVHYIDSQNSYGAVGYWLGKEFIGKGITTKACTGLINFCFDQLKLNRIEIKCATENYRSAAVAERLNFVKEGVLRKAERIHNGFIDLSIYALLKEDWAAASLPSQ